jgi:hypothetical protein
MTSEKLFYFVVHNFIDNLELFSSNENITKFTLLVLVISVTVENYLR